MGRASKLQLWKSFYLDAGNRDTFLNGTASAKAAQYKAKSENSFACIGHQNYRKLQNEIEQWLIENRFTDEIIKLKILEGLDAKETKFFQKDGVVTDQRECVAWGPRLGYTRLAAQVMGLLVDKVKVDEETIDAISEHLGSALERALDKKYRDSFTDDGTTGTDKN